MIRLPLRHVLVTWLPACFWPSDLRRLSGQAGPQKGEWTTYGADLANTRYSPLDQITRDNFGKLEVAWRFKTDALGPNPESTLRRRLMVGGMLYSTAGRDGPSGARRGDRRTAMDAQRGRRPRGAAAATPLGPGPCHWTDGRDARIVYVTLVPQSPSMQTGIPVPDSGKNGVVDLKLDDDQTWISSRARSAFTPRRLFQEHHPDRRRHLPGVRRAADERVNSG
jgi:quinoprotein glucose dehydrogenase